MHDISLALRFRLDCFLSCTDLLEAPCCIPVSLLMSERPGPSSSGRRFAKRSRLQSGALNGSDSDDRSDTDVRSSSGSELSHDGLRHVPFCHFPPPDFRDPWPPRPTEASQYALSLYTIPHDNPLSICPCCLQAAHSSALFPLLLDVSDTPALLGRDENASQWQYYCIHCHILFDEAVLNKIRLWVDQYLTFEADLKPLVYIRNELSFSTAPHSLLVDGLEGAHQDRPLAYLRDAFLDHTPPEHSSLRMEQGVAPWQTDARSVILTVCPAYRTCGRCNELLTRKCNGLQADRSGPDSRYIIAY